MHYKNQIDTVKTTIEFFYTIAISKGNEDLADEFNFLLDQIEGIIDNDYQTYSPKQYMDPVAESMSILFNANMIAKNF